jgi:hypothetical protein
MNKSIVRTILVTLLLAGGGSTAVLADGPNPRPPLCPPGINCQ